MTISSGGGKYPDNKQGDLVGKSGVELKWQAYLNGKRGGGTGRGGCGRMQDTYYFAQSSDSGRDCLPDHR